MTPVMIILVVLIAFIAGIEGILDEFQFHQPLVACTLIGIVCEQVEVGIILGGILQMIALGWANIGASVAPDVTLASIASSIILMISNQGISGIYTAIAIAIPLSMVGLFLTNKVRTFSVSLIHRMDEAALAADYRGIEKYHIMGICLQGLRVAIPACILLMIPSNVMQSFFMSIPDWLSKGIAIGGGMIVAVGYAIVINVLMKKEIIPFFILGFILAMISQLTLLSLALIAIALAVLYLHMKTKNNHNNDSQDPLGDILNDY